MGQYYRPYLIEEKTGKEIVLNRHIDGEYTMAKLMEHSWWENSLMNAVSHMIYQNPHKIAWVGDYADEFDAYERVWGDKVEGIGLKSVDFSLDNKYLVNHSKKIFLDCNEYKIKNEDSEGWTIHPLSLLTVIGNGRGGGDYRGVSMNIVGDWCMNVLSVEDKVPNGYTQVTCDFKE